MFVKNTREIVEEAGFHQSCKRRRDFKVKTRTSNESGMLCADCMVKLNNGASVIAMILSL